MSTLAKIVLGVACLLIVSCVVVAVLAAGSIGAVGLFAANIIQTDPARINTGAARIADFDLPAGYKQEAALEIAGYQYVSYSPGDGHSHIQFIQAPSGAVADAATLQQYAEQAAPQRDYDRTSRTKVVGQAQATVRGQSITLVVSEGINSDHQSYRSVTGVFQGRGGPVLLSVESPIATWNQAAVDRFIASIR